MSTFLNDKAVLNTNSVTNTDSLFIYLRDNGTQRKVTAKDIQSFLSQEGLSTRVHMSSATIADVGSMAVTTVTFDTASTNPYGMFNPNTPGILTMPFNGMVQAQGAAYFEGRQPSVVSTLTFCWVLKNGQRFPGCGNAAGFSRFDGTVGYPQTTNFMTAPFSVTSGDVISLQAQTAALSASIVASYELTFIELIPLKAWTA